MSVPLLDLGAQYARIRRDVEVAIREVFESQRFILGPTVERFEQAIADYIGVSHAIGVSSGSDALLAALMAEGVGAGDEVVTTPFSFFATVGAIVRLGARPVFVDIEPETYALDPARVEAAISPRTKALLVVHLFGQTAEMGPLVDLAERRGVLLIEDAAQAIGARFGARQAGTFGDYGCFSFFPSKNLGGAGDGGLVVCRNADRAARIRRLRVHGAHPKYVHSDVGGNFRLDALQAAVLGVKLGHLETWTEERRRNAARYRTLFVERGLSESVSSVVARESVPVVLPREADQRRHVYNQFVVRVAERDALREHLRARGIGHEVYYPLGLHQQPCLAHFGFGSGAFPVSERAAREVLALPIYPELDDDQARSVVDAFAEFYGGR